MNNNYFNVPMGMMRSVPTSTITPMGVRTAGMAMPKTGSLLSGGISTSKITFSGILNGASKTLGVINQAIPVFYQVKPMWNNAKTMFRVVKEINKSDNNTNLNNNNNNTSNNNSSLNKKEESNAPTFFA